MIQNSDYDICDYKTIERICHDKIINIELMIYINNINHAFVKHIKTIVNCYKNKNCPYVKLSMINYEISCNYDPNSDNGTTFTIIKNNTIIFQTHLNVLHNIELNVLKQKSQNYNEMRKLSKQLNCKTTLDFVNLNIDIMDKIFYSDYVRDRRQY